MINAARDAKVSFVQFRLSNYDHEYKRLGICKFRVTEKIYLLLWHSVHSLIERKTNMIHAFAYV